MTLAQQHLTSRCRLGIGCARLVQRILVGLAHQVVHHAPHAVEELVHAGQAVLVPLQLLIRRSHEQDVGAHGVAAVARDHLLGGDDVALGLAHDVAVLVKHHALAQQVLERLVEVQHAQIAQHLREEAAVQQVQDGVLDAADVLVDRHPAVGFRAVEGQLGVVRVGVAQVIPARARERVHGIGLTASLAAALRARALREALVRCQGLAGGKVDVLGQAHRQVFFRHRHQAALIAVDHRDGVAPIALAGDQPVAQAELHLALAAARGLQIGNDGLLALGMLAARKAGVLAGLHQSTLGLHGAIPIDAGDHTALFVFELLEQRVVVTQDDGDDGQVVFLGELEVALVAARHSHNRAGAVIGHDVVGNPHGHLLAVDGVHHITAGERTVLLLVALRTLDGGDLLRVLDHLHDRGLILRALDQALQDGAFRGKQEEAAAEQGVGTRGEHGDQVVFRGILGCVALLVAQRELHLGALGAADPVRLHLLDALRPAVQLIQVVQKLLRVIGDLEIPLRQVALLDGAVATPALALGDLLVGEHGLALRAPVHRRVATLHQAALPELQEDPLAPAVVLGVARHDGTVPVIGKAHALEAGLLGFDVGIGPLRRMAVMLDGRVLSRQAERVPTHGMQHVEATHLGIAGDDVADRVVAHMAHMDVARRVREHLEHVLLGLGVIFGDLVQVGIFPSLLPTRFDLVRVVLFHRPSSLADAVIHIGFIVAAPRFHEGKKRQHPRQGKPSGLLGKPRPAFVPALRVRCRKTTSRPGSPTRLRRAVKVYP